MTDIRNLSCSGIEYVIFTMTNRLRKNENPENRFVKVFKVTYFNFGVQFF